MSIDIRCTKCGNTLISWITEDGDEYAAEPCSNGCTNAMPNKYETSEEFAAIDDDEEEEGQGVVIGVSKIDKSINFVNCGNKASKQLDATIKGFNQDDDLLLEAMMKAFANVANMEKKQ